MTNTFLSWLSNMPASSWMILGFLFALLVACTIAAVKTPPRIAMEDNPANDQRRVDNIVAASQPMPLDMGDSARKVVRRVRTGECK